jgi:flagellar basal-body rod modification protein FlgD
MSTISSVSSAANPLLTGADTPATSSVPQKTLGQNDFLKLLATQFKMQDPMKPVEDTAFIAQMAQFTALQQSSTMAQTMTAMRADEQRATANSYLGHQVTVDAGNGEFDAGNVSAIDSSGAEPQLVINGNFYPISAVLRVEPGVVTAPQPATTGGA